MMNTVSLVWHFHHSQIFMHVYTSLPPNEYKEIIKTSIADFKLFDICTPSISVYIPTPKILYEGILQIYY